MSSTKVTYADTQNMEEIGNEIVRLANDYQVLITKLYKRLNDIPYNTKEWVGDQAIKYARIVSLDKPELYNFGDRIKDYGKKIINASQKINNNIRVCNDEESQKEIL